MLEELLVGVDEAGRGPLAGPVAVGIVAVLPRFDLNRMFPGLNDSKKLSPKKREEIYDEVIGRMRAGEIKFCVRFSGSNYIDSFGINRATRRAIWSGVRTLVPENAGIKVFLDGLLAAPPEYNQKTIIGGDMLLPVISLASVVAKVRRDKLMERLSEDYPEYGFKQHKGYGTPEHRHAIKRYGLTDIHRKSFCSGV